MSTVPLDLQTDTVILPPPAFPSGASLEHALTNRRSAREFLADSLPLATVSTLLWAGAGINRHESGHRTAPSAHNWQEISLFAVMAEGAYRYDAEAHRMLLVSAEDLRALTGVQAFVGSAPLNLVYVADFARMHDCRPEEHSFFAGADAACAAQNVLLTCAGLGLATVIRALIDRRRLAEALRLKPTERIALAQSIGYSQPIR